ncbi:hypothetical protein NM688_g1776 [Phlebia brevispora]|uniref:Uncharacterized protein n=1 Tax=Phlebia brevispora TaxID=194682 RepID=A0ACC1TAQ5_9APHY|nr:hypothetical protein NM688_g1776 [Phlebia brevispora]
MHSVASTSSQRAIHISGGPYANTALQAYLVTDETGLYNRPLRLSQGVVRAVIAIVSQAFTITYCAALVLLTQRITLNEFVKHRQTLTAIHDKSSAWLGLGTSLLTLGRQAKLATDLLGICMITAYLLLIFVVHTTLPSIFGVSTQNVTVNAIQSTTLARQNVTAALNNGSGANFGLSADALSNLYAILQVYDSLDLPTVGVLDGTLYDILPITQNAAAIGVEVNATTFSVDCASLSDAVQVDFQASNITQIANGTSYYTFEFGSDQYAVVIGVMGANQFQVQSAYAADSSVPDMVVVASTYPVVDSAGDNATSTNLNPTWTDDPVHPLDANTTTITGINLIGCNFGAHNSTALVNPQSRTINQPSASPSPAHWHEWTDPDPSGDPLLMDTLQAFVNNAPSLTLADQSIALVNDTFNGLSYTATPTILEQFLQIDISASRNASLDASGPVTVGELNWSLARAYAAVLWYYDSASATSLNVVFDDAGADRLEGEVSIPYSLLEERMTINRISLFAGLAASCVLFALAGVMIIRSGGLTENVAQHDPTGVLPILWLLRLEPRLRAVANPDMDALREAGMYEVTGMDELRQHADQTLNDSEKVQDMALELQPYASRSSESLVHRTTAVKFTLDP